LVFSEIKPIFAKTRDMEKITKKQIKLIKEGYHDVLMDCLDFLLDSYDENKFDSGYRSCMEDMSVRSERLAEHILKTMKKKELHVTVDKRGFASIEFDSDELAKIIEEYFTEALKQ